MTAYMWLLHDYHPGLAALQVETAGLHKWLSGNKTFSEIKPNPFITQLQLPLKQAD